MATIEQKVKAPRPRIFYGWWIVGAGLGMSGLSSTLFVYGFGAYFIAWRQAFGWPRATLGSMIGLSRLEGGVFGPIAGWLIDRHGPRIMMFVGVTVFGLGFIALSRVNSLTSLYIVYLGLLATGSSLGTLRPIQVAIANWFIRQRGRAMGILMAGWGVGGSFVFLLGFLIEAYGWRTTALLAGLAVWIVGFPLALVVRHRPEQMGLLPDGDTTSETAAVTAGVRAESSMPQGGGSGSSGPEASSDAQKPRAFWMRDPRPEIDLTVGQALRTQAFWLMAVTYAIWAATPTINTVYLAPFLSEELKVDYVVALGALSFFAFTTTFGRLAFGFLGDFLNIRMLVAALLVLEGVGIWLFSHVQTMAQVPFYVIIFAVAHGGIIPLRTVLQGYFFGRKQFGTIGGVMTLVDLPATVTAPIWVAWLADTVPDGYRVGFRIIAVSLAVAAVAILLARRPRPPFTESRLPLFFRTLRRG